MNNIEPLVEAYTKQVRSIYGEAEFSVLQKLAKRIEKGIDVDSDHWLIKKLAEIQAFNKEIGVHVAHLSALDPIIEKATQEAYESGEKWAVDDLKRAKLLDRATNADYGRNERIRKLTNKTIDNLHKSHTAILRGSADIFRRVASETNAQILTGVLTRRQAAQVALDKYAAGGIKTFVDNGGRVWDLASYAEMSARTGMAQSSNDAYWDKLKANDRDLVVVSDDPEPCPVCEPFEGQIFSVSGSSDKYPALDDAISEGLFHPCCLHRTHLYVEGLTEIEKIEKDPEKYKEKQQQRALERDIRRYKNLSAVAITPEAKAKAENGLNQARANMKDFIDDTGRKRDYARESITRAR